MMRIWLSTAPLAFRLKGAGGGTVDNRNQRQGLPLRSPKTYPNKPDHLSSIRATFSILLVVFAIYGEAKSPPPPPRNADDVLAVLDQYKANTARVEKLKEIAESTPPQAHERQELAIYYHRRARANEGLGRASKQIADLEAAIRYVQPNALPEPEGIGEIGRIRVDLSYADFFAGNWAKAIELWQNVANVNGAATQAAAYAELGDLTAARQALTRLDGMLDRVRWTSDWQDFGFNWQAQAERSHGMLLEAEGNFVEAERRYRKALELVARQYDASLELGDSNRYISVRSRILFSWSLHEAFLARSLRRQGKLAEASFYSREALVRSLEAFGRDSHYTATFITELGWSVFESGQFLDASKLAQVAIDSFLRAGVLPESIQLAEARRLLGASIVALGRWQQAISIFEERDKALASDPVQYAEKNGIDLDWGIALLREGKASKALGMLEGIYRKRLSMGLAENEYFTAQSRGFYALALAANGEAKKAFVEFRASLPALLDDARRDEGDERGGAIARQKRLVWILEGYMKLLIDLRDSPVLRSEGVDAIAEAFRIADVARGSSVQRALVESAARFTPRDPALADLARQEQDAQHRFVTASDLLNRLLSAPPERQLSKVISDLRRDINTLRITLNKLKIELDQRFPDYAELLSPKPATVKQIQATLEKGEALISVYVGDDRTYVFAVPRDGAIAFTEAALTDVQVRQIVIKLRKALDVGDATLYSMPRFDFMLSHQLYVKLLQPVATVWSSAKHLIVVPHKSLGQLPFALLTTGLFERQVPRDAEILFAEYRRAPWLIRRAAISQLPSASTLLALRRMYAAPFGRRAFIGFGDPVFRKSTALAPKEVTTLRRSFRDLRISLADSAPMASLKQAPVPLPDVAVANSSQLAQLAELPDTALEVRRVAEVVHADASTDVFLGRAANETNVKSGLLENRRIVMFATHGLVPGDLDGLTQPALALSAPEVTGNSGEDGLLTMEEIFGLKLNADWVVLSACNTAAGDGAGSEAVSGLGKAFFFAGARTLLVSNWAVETVSARLLTTKLFEFQISNPTASRADALRLAMLELMDRTGPQKTPDTPTFAYAHPLFWAPFSLVGDGSR